MFVRNADKLLLCMTIQTLCLLVPIAMAHSFTPIRQQTTLNMKQIAHVCQTIIINPWANAYPILAFSSSAFHISSFSPSIFNFFSSLAWVILITIIAIAIGLFFEHQKNRSMLSQIIWLKLGQKQLTY